MRSETEVLNRILEIKNNLLIIEQRTAEQLKNNHKDRDYRLLRFLYKEKSVWEFTLLQMEWLLSDK